MKRGMGRTGSGRRPKGPVSPGGGGTAPIVTATAPINGNPDRAVTVKPKFTFDMAMDAATMVAGNFSISPSVGFTVSYDPATLTVTLTPDSNLANGTTYTVEAHAGVTNAGGTPLAQTGLASFSFTTIASPGPADLIPLGYARVIGVTGGGSSGTIYDCDTWAKLQTALQASGTRRIIMHGNAVLDAGGASFNITNGNFTLDGSDWTGVLKNYKLVFKCSNVIITQMAMRTGEGVSQSASSDRRAISFNPGSGGVITKFLIDHCSFAWGPDVIFSAINHTTDLTAQHCLFGPSLYKSNIASSPNGYGPNVTVPGNNLSNEPTEHGERMTFYRCLMAFNHQRNLKYEFLDFGEAINCAIYGWGNQAGHGNPRGASIVGCMYKKSPDTAGSDEVWEPDTNYAQFPASTYFPLSGSDRNIGIGFTPTVNISGAARLSSPFATLTESVVTPDATLFATVVNAAGRTYQDDIDTDTKARAIAGTSLGGDGFYNGAGFPAPHPSWTAGA